MKRDPVLRELSSEHHQALVLARALQPDTPAELRGELPPPGPELIAQLRARFARELAPHFRLEEREILPLSDCGPVALRAHAERIRREHAELRGLVEVPDGALTLDAAARFGRLLAEHVRFEEREWFPALEASLDAATRASLQLRLKRTPEARIAGFHQDEAGVWVAELDCGHARHVRHAPPLQLAEWVTSEAGRAQRFGQPIACQACRMPRLPSCARVYRETPIFDAQSVPAGLLRRHTLREASWARIVVHAGRVLYVLEDEDDLTLALHAELPGIVAPGRPHHVEPSPDARFHVEFLRVPDVEADRDD